MDLYTRVLADWRYNGTLLKTPYFNKQQWCVVSQLRIRFCYLLRFVLNCKQ